MNMARENNRKTTTQSFEHCTKINHEIRTSLNNLSVGRGQRFSVQSIMAIFRIHDYCG